ncbi:MAG: hypothetical protein F4166_07800 [Gammaproteobacteria bacterium]|nr:hypothetical protein [Gammaproteobacteria bacterium]
MSSFNIFAGRDIIAQVDLSNQYPETYFEVEETTHIGFEILNYDDHKDYQIFVGDFPLTIDPSKKRNDICWPASAILDGANGITNIVLRDKNTEIQLAEIKSLVKPSKISTEAYENMFNDMRQISVELMLDLIAKSRVTIAGGLALQNDSTLKGLTARVELAQIQHFWRYFSIILADIYEQPNYDFQKQTKVRCLQLGERLDGDIVRKFAERGLRPRELPRTNIFLNLPTAQINKNTLENRVLVAFVNLLRKRVKRSLNRAIEEYGERKELLKQNEHGDQGISKFLRLSEYPKIARLEEIINRGEILLGEMYRAILSPNIPVIEMTLQNYFDSFETPVFSSHPRYSEAAMKMKSFLSSMPIIVEHGESERTKTLDKIYEQWSFFQIYSGLVAVGLDCISHHSIFELVNQERYSVDLKRNSAIEFLASDGRKIRLRYEPIILSDNSVTNNDTLFHGISNSPLTPDIVMEIFEHNDELDEESLVFAVVIDTKYTSVENTEKKLETIAKYKQIRGMEKKSQIIRQLWVMSPIHSSIRPRDKTIAWSNIETIPLDVIEGVIGADPANNELTKETIKSFLLGILHHAKAYARTVNTNA